MQGHLELNPAREAKDNKKEFPKSGGKEDTREIVSPLLSKTGDLMAQHMEKAEVLNVFFLLVFMSKTGHKKSNLPETRGKVQRMEDLPLVEEDWLRDYLSKSDICKFMGPEGMQPQVLKDDVTL